MLHPSASQIVQWHSRTQCCQLITEVKLRCSHPQMLIPAQLTCPYVVTLKSSNAQYVGIIAHAGLVCLRWG